MFSIIIYIWTPCRKNLWIKQDNNTIVCDNSTLNFLYFIPVTCIVCLMFMDISLIKKWAFNDKVLSGFKLDCTAVLLQSCLRLGKQNTHIHTFFNSRLSLCQCLIVDVFDWFRHNRDYCHSRGKLIVITV